MNFIKSIRKFKNQIFSLLKENDLNKKYLEEQFNEIIKQNKYNDDFYSKVLELFVHLNFEEKDALEHWQNILKNYEFFKKNFTRDVGLRVAMFDYFINSYKSIDNPILVDFQFFKETEKLAMIDSLTSIFNRRYFDITFDKELKRVIKHDKLLSIILLDIDNFKSINDNKGHLFGDKILVDLAKFLKQNCREEDILCRYGGEEFIIIQPETTGDEALKIAEEIREGFKKIDFFNIHNISFSGGIASYPYDGQTVEELIKNADKALYAAKYTGKDCIIKSKLESRRYKRFNKSWKLKYHLISKNLDKEKTRDTYTQDVSAGGLCFESDDIMSLDSQLLLNIELPDKENIIIVGQVVRQEKITDSRYNYGVQFNDTTSDKLNKIKNVLYGSDTK